MIITNTIPSPVVYNIGKPRKNIAPFDWPTTMNGCSISYTLLNADDTATLSIFSKTSYYARVFTGMTNKVGTYHLKLVGTTISDS